MYCMQCGTKLSSTAKFCHRCGTLMAAEDAVGQISARPSRNRARRLLLGCAGAAFLALFLCSTAATILYFWLGFNHANQTAVLIPAEETTAFASITPSPLQLMHLWRLRDLPESAPALAPFALVPGVAEAGSVVQQHLPRSVQVEPVTDILPWIGPEISLAVLEEEPLPQARSGRLARRTSQVAGTYSGPPLILSIATRNSNRTTTFLDDVRSQMEEEGVVFVNSVYQDVLITEVGAPAQLPLAYATFDEMLVLATDASTLQRAIDTAFDETSNRLVDAPDFQETLAELPSNRLGFVYLDAQRVANELEVPPQMWQIHAAQSIGLSIALHRDGVRLDYVLDFETSDLNSVQTAWLRLPQAQSRFAEQAPTNCLFYFSGQNLLLLLESFLDEEFQTVMTELESGVDFALWNSLLQISRGEYAVALIEDRRSIFSDDLPLSILLFADVDDRQQVENTLQELGGMVAALEGASFHQDEINRMPVWLLEDPSDDAAIGYGVNDNTVFLGTSYNALRSVTQSRQSSLADSPLFRSATAPLPDQFREYLYVDVQQLARIMERSNARDLRDDDVWRYMQAIEAISLAVVPLDAGDRLHGMLFIVTRE